MQRLPAIVIVVLVLAVVNGCLYVVQEGEYRDAMAKVEAFEEQMRPRWDGFLSAKGHLERLGSQIEANKQQVVTLAAQIDAIEAEHPSGIPKTLYDRYTALVHKHNRLIRQTRPLIAEFNAKAKIWNVQLDTYNGDVQKYNELVAAVPTSRWFILPGLGSRSGARAAKPTFRPAPVRP